MKIVGILGGMGPLATLDLANKIVKNTKANSDNEHIHTIIDCNCQIPDRTAYILNAGSDPTTQLCETAKNLQNAGAEFIIIACNTAHYFYESITNSVKIPVLNIIKETANSISVNEKTALLATQGNYKAKIYENIFNDCNKKLFIPSDEIKEKLHSLIYEYKNGKGINAKLIDEINDYLLDNHIQNIILGCTELPIIYENYNGKLKKIDPTDILAKSTVKLAGATLV